MKEKRENLIAELESLEEDEHYPRIAVYSDGNLVAMECISEEKTYRINSGYSGTEITLTKLSEAMHSSVKITKVASYSAKDVKPAEEKELKIEFIVSCICGSHPSGG